MLLDPKELMTMRKRAMIFFLLLVLCLILEFVPGGVIVYERVNGGAPAKMERNTFFLYYYAPAGALTILALIMAWLHMVYLSLGTRVGAAFLGVVATYYAWVINIEIGEEFSIIGMAVAVLLTIATLMGLSCFIGVKKALEEKRAEDAAEKND